MRGPEGINRTMQYGGKWPLIRVLGFQEFFSSIFSVGNLLPAIWAFYTVWTSPRLLNTPNGIRRMYLIYASTACLAWIFSAIYHARDTSWSEYLDYAFSDIFVGFGLIVSIQRSWNFKSTRNVALAYIFGSIYTAGQVIWFYIRRDYGENTRWAGATTAIFTVHWLVYVYRFGAQRRSFVWKVVAFQIIGWLVSMNEFFDYSPFFDLLDAHAIWHGATIPLGSLWWPFIVDDAAFEGVVEEKRHKID